MKLTLADEQFADDVDGDRLREDCVSQAVLTRPFQIAAPAYLEEARSKF